VGKNDILWTAGSFVLGLLFVVLAQIAAFFTMAKRSEGMKLLQWEQRSRVAALGCPQESPLNAQHRKDADDSFKDANRRLGHSDTARGLGLTLFFMSLVAFVIGCGLGGRAVFAAKDRAEPPGINKPIK
jgi:hypothetical protein